MTLIRSTAFGLLAIVWGLVSYALEGRSKAFTLSLGFSSMAGAIYAVAVGIWPFALAEIVWSAVSFHKWLKA